VVGKLVLTKSFMISTLMSGLFNYAHREWWRGGEMKSHLAVQQLAYTYHWGQGNIASGVLGYMCRGWGGGEMNEMH